MSGHERVSSDERVLADEAARTAIRSNLEDTLFVEAAAGTGKTTALVGRIVEVLRQGRGALEDIVAVTFTEKAAGEMKLRLRSDLEAARRETERVDGEASGNLERALEQLELAHIGTIHGFCTDLLKERPIEAGVDPAFQVAAEDEAGRLLDAAFERWFKDALADPPPGVRRALRRNYSRNSGGPHAALRAAAGKLVEHRDFDAAWTRPDVDRAAELDRAVTLVAELGAYAARAARPEDWLTKNLANLERWSRELSLREAVHGRDHDYVEAQLRSLVRAKWKGWHWRGFNDKEFGDGLAKAEVRARRDEVHQELARILAAIDADLAALLREELRPVIAVYETLKRREGRVDFVDLLLRTRDLLRENAEIRRHYQRRFSHFFVDEFQDTDPLQVEILFLLCASDSSERSGAGETSVDAAPERGKLFLVGDPKQSIYRFRRADVMLYEQTKERLASAGARVLHLTTSFRSQPRIQETVNTAFRLRMTGSADGSQAKYVPLSPYRDDLADQPAVIALPVPQPNGKYGTVHKKAIEESLPDAVGAAVDWLVHESGWKVTERDTPDVPVPVEPRHVCLLFRRFQSWGTDITRPYVRALEARAIPHVLVGGRSYFDREEVLAVRNALTSIEWPDDRLSVYGALRGPLFSLGDGSLLHFTSDVGPLHPLRPFGPHDDLEAMAAAGLAPELRAVSEALAILGRLHRTRNRRPIPETILDLLAAVRAHAGIAIWPTGEQALANVLRVVDRARAFEKAGAPSFRAFLDRLEDEAERGQAEEAPIVEEGTEGVRMMTVHKAKGLEFPVVILADMTCNATFATPNRHVDANTGLWAEPLCGAAPLDLLEHLELERRRERAEADRLTYVAATRARDLLIVPALHEGRDGKGGLPEEEDWWWLDVLNPALHDVGWWDPATLDLGVDAPTARRQQRLLEVDDEAQPTLSVEEGIAAHDAWQATRAENLETGARAEIAVSPVKELARDSAEPGEPLPEGGEVEWIDVPRPGESAQPGERRPGESARPGGNRFGALVHAALATLPLDGERAAVRGAVECQALALAATDAEVEAAVSLVERAFAHPVIRRAASSERILREIPLLDAREVPTVEGVADVAFRPASEAGGAGGATWMVVDYKTDRHISPENRAMYEAQVARYAAILSAATGESARGIVLAL